MRVPVSWLREYVTVPDAIGTDEIADALVRVGHEVEAVERVGADVAGLVVGRVRSVEELTGFRKPVRFCRVDVGDRELGIVCGASNFVAGDVVPVAVPGAVLPGGFAIGERQTYGRVSQGMICSAAELGVGDDHSGILVLDADTPVGADAVTLLALRDDVLDLAVTPDRGYCLSVRGIARELAVALELEFRDPAERDVPGPAAAAPWAVRIEDPAGCDRYVARVLTGLDPTAASPWWLRRAVALGGMRPISLAVDVTNVVMLALGQPLHAFDADRLRGAIVVRRAAPGERLETLDGVDRPLDPEDLVIADDSGAIAVAGVMGGASTEIHAGTTRVVVESAHFDAVSVARSGRRHGLASEASRRFERGVDPLLAAAAADLAVELLVRLGGATAVEGVTDVGEPRLGPAITLHATLPSRVIGLQYPEHAVVRRLEQIGCAVEPSGGEVLSVTPPSWRPDLRDPIDFVEEVARFEGYDAIPVALPAVPAGGGGLSAAQRRRRAVARALAYEGLVEVWPSPFVAAGAFDALGLPPDDDRRRALRLANPLSEEAALVRTTLLPGLFAAVARNTGRGAVDVSLFEVGQVALPNPDWPGGGDAHELPRAPRPPVTARPDAATSAALEAALPRQPQHVAGVLSGDRDGAGWWGAGRAATWADAVEILRLLGTVADVAVEVVRADRAPWHPGRCAALRLAGSGEAAIGYAGELHPRVVSAFGLPARACAFEVDLGALLAVEPDQRGAPDVSAFPPATLDVALVVPDDVPAGSVADALTTGAGDLLESLRLFDVYSGPQVGEGRRSLAYALVLRASDRTLTAEEALAVRDAAVAEAARRTGATLRA